MYPRIICVGRNYAAHIDELGNERPDDIVLFIKPYSVVEGASEIASTHMGEPLHYECEICFEIDAGQFSRVGLGLDFTKRRLQSDLKAKGLPWEKAKAFTGAAAFSDFVDIDCDVDAELALRFCINDALKQQGDVTQMLYKPSHILREVEKHFGLVNGDIIMTGTPKGVGELQQGQRLEAQLLSNQPGDKVPLIQWHLTVS